MELAEKKSPYPPHDEEYINRGFGYASDMMAIAVNLDDAETFIKYMDECGGVDCDVLIAGSVINYAAIHGAPECVKAVYAAGGGKDKPLKHWLKIADSPAYGPRVKMIVR
jgi:hypothetical protein